MMSSNISNYKKSRLSIAFVIHDPNHHVLSNPQQWMIDPNWNYNSQIATKYDQCKIRGSWTSDISKPSAGMKSQKEEEGGSWWSLKNNQEECEDTWKRGILKISHLFLFVFIFFFLFFVLHQKKRQENVKRISRYEFEKSL